jgi:uncharacterized membrane-anchored protein
MTEPCWRSLASILCAVGLLGLPDVAHAFQAHPEQEGLYVHQLAHVFFGVAMGMLAYWLEKNRFSSQKGWRLIQISCLLFILWNVSAFVGHIVEELLPKEALVGSSGWNRRILIGGDVIALLYYVLKMDHLVCVPAMVCLFLGIRILYRQPGEQEKHSDV